MENDPLAQTNLILAIVGLITAILGVPPLIVSLLKTMRRERTQAELEVLRQIATASVAAVEQTMWKGKTNDQKLAAALELATTQLRAYGMKISEDQLRSAIEAAVLLTKAGLQLPPPPADPQTPTPVDS